MQRLLLILFVALIPTSLCLPAYALAARGPATFTAARSLVAASSSPGNVYLAGVSVVNTASVTGDLSAIGGSIITAAPVSGDELLLAGSVNSRAPVTGDVRVLGGGVAIEGPITGDLFALGLSVHNSGRTSGSTFIIAADTILLGGAAGPVTVYGNNVLLGGDFAGDVTVVATGHLSLAAETTIRGTLSYEAPDEAFIPASATILGGIEYTNASYLPDAGTSRILAFLSIGFFVFAHILGALILAGLLTGLFPRLAEAIVERAYTGRPRNILLTMLLGFAIVVATPVLIALLALTFVGFGLSLLLCVLYAALVILAFLYAGILVGGMFVRRFTKREAALWHDGMLGMLALLLAAFVPYIGLLAVLVFSLFSAGALLQIFFHFAFPHEERTPELL